MQSKMKKKIMSDDEFFAKIPMGFKFQPTNEEVLSYLDLKIKNQPLPGNMIHVVNLYQSNPENLAGNYKAIGEKNEWYFFTSRQKKYKNGLRPDRSVAAGDGYWKVVGADRPITKHNINGVDEEIGCKKSLVYNRGKPSAPTKTDWLMTEFRVKNAPAPIQTPDNNMRLDDWVVCRMYKNTKKLGGTKRNREEIEYSTTIIPNYSQPPLPLDMSKMEQQLMMEDESLGELGLEMWGPQMEQFPPLDMSQVEQQLIMEDESLGEVGLEMWGAQMEQLHSPLDMSQIEQQLMMDDENLCELGLKMWGPQIEQLMGDLL